MNRKKKEEKIQYTVPKLIPLNQGDYLVSEGGGCSEGAGFVTGTCSDGTSADSCSTGTTVVWCNDGSGAAGSGCANGIDASGHGCDLGSMDSTGCNQGSGV